MCSRASRTVSQAPSGALVAASLVTCCSGEVGTGARNLGRLGGAGRRRALEEELAALHPRPGAQLEDLVGRAQRVLVVLDHQDGVAAVAQRPQLAEQPRVVVGMQADARLVEDVDDADQAHAELGGQAHPLGLPPESGRVVAVEREVAEAGLEQEMQPLLDPADHVARAPRPRRRRRSQARRDRWAAATSLARNSGRVSGPAPEPRRATDRPAAGVQPGAVAFRALAADHEGRQPRAETLAVGVPEAFVQVGDDAGKGLGAGRPASGAA